MVSRERITRAEEYPGDSNSINKILIELEQQFSGCGMQQAYVSSKSAELPADATSAKPPQTSTDAKDLL